MSILEKRLGRITYDDKTNDENIFLFVYLDLHALYKSLLNQTP